MSKDEKQKPRFLYVDKAGGGVTLQEFGTSGTYHTISHHANRKDAESAAKAREKAKPTT